MTNHPDKPNAFSRLDLASESKGIRKRIDSRELFGAVREVVIDHVGEEYRLRITNQGKLILTK
jgi:hemin uptake protein HemP